MTISNSTTSPINLLGIAGATILFGALMGGLTNSINGSVSPIYFVNLFGWQDVQNVWRASIALGTFAGFNYGVFFAIIFTTFVGWISKGKCTFGFAFRYLLLILLAVLIFWIVGGVGAVLLAWFSPEFFSHTFISVPKELPDMLRYAWVGGSIGSAMIGGFISLAVGCILFRSKWYKTQRKRGYQ